MSPPCLRFRAWASWYTGVANRVGRSAVGHASPCHPATPHRAAAARSQRVVSGLPLRLLPFALLSLGGVGARQGDRPPLP